MVEISESIDGILRSESEQVQQDIIILLESWMGDWSRSMSVDFHNNQLLDDVCQKVIDGRRRVYNKINKSLMQLGEEK